MPDTLEDFLQSRPPTAERPLLGQTILVVEDSRFASEAIRLLCLRSGARIRRADTLRSAARHLCTYRPSIAIVDIGLPDGSGLELVAELAAAAPRVPVIIATSGDDTAEGSALAAGADGFLAKPVLNLASFQEIILSQLPEGTRPKGLRVVTNDDVVPDRIAYRDDLAHIAELLEDTENARVFSYALSFLAGVAKTADDQELIAAVAELEAKHNSSEAIIGTLARVAGMIEARLTQKEAV
ncbi:MAG: response regulator [Pseudomonadota bacterium]